MKTDLPKDACLNCGHELNAASNTTGDAQPEPGDITICFYCGHLMEFDADLRLVKPSDATLSEIAGVPGFIRAMNTIAEAKAMQQRDKHDDDA
jgi:hypothetical protein